MVTTDLVILCLGAFGAGLVDSIVGGGGLIQLPILMMVNPTQSLVNILGTNKLISICGTAFSAFRYSQQISFSKKILTPGVLSAFIFSALGAYTVSIMNPSFLKPIIIISLCLVFFMTIKNKSFGMEGHKMVEEVPLWKPLLIGSLLGFYDGFFGPGTGSILIIFFISLMSMTFVQGSAYAKIINLATNLAAVLYFIYKGHILINIAVPMMVFNVLGAYVGVKFALLKGNNFVRGLLRIMVFLTIIKLSYEYLLSVLS